jgi:hypothetical protein
VAKIQEGNDMNDFAAGAVLSRGHTAEVETSGVCQLNMTVDDALIVPELLAYGPGPEREKYALTALRIGVLALKQAQGRLDADVIRGEGDRLLATLESRLTSHQRSVQEHIAATLREYFDPKSGRFNERVEQLVKTGGDLERLLRSQIGQSDSELAKTLASHFGEQSTLMKILRPSETEGILNSLSLAMKAALESQRNAILAEFSLDNGGGALARLVKELTERHGQLANGLKESVDEVIGEFSLDKPDSALSRLVGQVEIAQRKISSEFSLDAEHSALARMKKELEQLIGKHNKDNDEFRAHVRESLAALQARKEESQRSTRHGLEFEQAVCEFMASSAQAAGDIVEHVGHSTGLIKNCKTGDAVLTLGPEHAAAGSRIVLEAKQHASYNLAQALAEIEQARKNRQAGVGVFVFSKRTLAADIAPLARFGNDIVVVWDYEDASTDVVLSAALSLARALCARAETDKKQLDLDLERMQKAMLEVEKQVQGMDEIRKCAQSIRSSAEKIEERARIVSDNIVRSTNILNEETEAICGLVKSDGSMQTRLCCGAVR